VRVGIIGAGVGGLTAALALHTAGFDSEVFDAAAGPREVDHPLALAANATRILRALQLLDAVDAVATRPHVRHLRGWKSSYIIGFLPLGAHHEARYGAPYLHVARSALLRVLYDAAIERGITVHWQTPCLDVSQTDSYAAARFAAGERRFDALLGCDGAASRVRRALSKALAETDTRTLCYGVVEAAGLPTSCTAPAETIWIGPRQHVWHAPLEAGAQIGFAAMLPATPQPYTPATLQSAFTAWHPELRRLVAHIDAFEQQRSASFAAASTCAAGRIALAGDACQPLPGCVSHGAAAAIEDAWVLARLLDDAEDDPTAAMAEYQFYRAPRRQRLQSDAEQCIALYQCTRPWARLTRNLRLSFTSRLLPDVVAQEGDWLNGYDAIKGFG